MDKNTAKCLELLVILSTLAKLGNLCYDAPMRYRWLDSLYPVVSCGKKSVERGNVGTIEVLPIPNRIGNCLVNFDGRRVVCPAGTLRNTQMGAQTMCQSVCGK